MDLRVLLIYCIKPGIFIGHSKLNSHLSGYLLKQFGSVGRLEKGNEKMNIFMKGV